MSTFRDVLASARVQIKEAQPDQVDAQLKTGQPPVLIDIREPEEFQQGIIPGAVVIPRGYLERRMECRLLHSEQSWVAFVLTARSSAAPCTVLR